MNRVEHFRRARKMVEALPGSYRIRYWPLKNPVCGQCGFAWSLEELVMGTAFKYKLAWFKGSTRPSVWTIRHDTPRLDWTIVDYSDIWRPEK